MGKRIFQILLLVSAILVALFFYKRYRIAPNIAEKRVVFNTPNGLDSLGSYLDDNVLVVFFAGWCGTCHKEMPGIVKAYPLLHENGIEVIGLTDDRPSAITSFQSRYNPPFGLYQLEGTLHDIDIYTLPTVLLMNTEGKIVFEHVEYMDWNNQNEVQRVLDSVK